MKIVTCNGCFDGLHPGHLFFFGYCLSKGDELVVGINSDDYIRKRKNRLFFNQYNRKSLLESLGIFKEVIIFYEDTPEKFLYKVKPDIHCTGEEYGEDCVDAQICKKLGIELYLIPRLEKWASSNLKPDLVKYGINF